MASLADTLKSRHTGDDVEASPDPKLSSPLDDSKSTSGPAPAPVSEPAESNGSTKPAVNLAALPQLRGSKTTAGTSPKWGAVASPTSTGSTASSGPSSPAISRLSTPQSHASRSSPTVITVSLDTPSDASVISQAVKHVSQTRRVVIELSKAPISNKATFMIKGPSTESVEAAKKLLESSLSPKVQQQLTIPQTARAALFGIHGVNIRGIEREHNVKIDVKDNASSPWSLADVLVTIAGSSTGVQAAVKDVENVVDLARRVESSRKISPKLHRFLVASDEFGPLVDPKVPKIRLEGSLSDVRDQMNSVDALLDDWHANYESMPLPTTSIPIPSDLVLSEFGVIVHEKELYGPPDALPAALKRVEKYLSTQTSSTLDISQAHDRDLAHARLLGRFFSATKFMEKIEQDYSVFISGPNLDEGVTYTITGETSRVNEARRAIVREVKNLSPTSLAVVRGMRFPVVKKQAAQQIRTLKGPVSGILGPSDELYLLYTEPDDDFSPQQLDVRRYIDDALAQLAPLMDLAKNIVKKSVKVERANLVRPRGPEAKKLFDEVIGSHKNVDIEVEDSDTVVLTGTKDAVNAAAEVVPRIVQLSWDYAVRSSHVEAFDVDSSIIANLIGRQGSQIQSLRSNYDVQLNIDENGHVQIVGLPENTKACAKEILEIQRRFRDEATENLAIPAVYHAKLIGPKGKHVKRLRDQYQAIIRFPKQRSGSQEPEEEGELTPSDEDTIFIRGPSRGVAAIKKEFLELVAYEKSQSYTETLKVKGSAIPRVVGRGGLAINSIRNSTGASINVGTANDKDEDVEISVVGERKAVQEAVSKIKESAEAALDLTEVTIDADPSVQRLIIGPQGSTRRELVSEAGGDPEQASRVIIAENSAIRLVGPSSVVVKLQDRIAKILDDSKRRSQVSATFSIPRDRLKFVLGTGGAKRRDLEESHDVFIQIPKDSRSSTVELTIQGENDAKINEVLAQLRKLCLPAEKPVEICAPAWNQRLRSSVQSKFGVRVNLVASTSQGPVQEPPSPPSNGTEWDTETTGKKVTVLINGETEDACEKAAKYLLENGKADTYGFLWIPQSKHRAIIGAGGKTISKLRSESKATIEVPGSYSESHRPIVIVGTVAQVERAKSLVEAAAKN